MGGPQLRAAGRQASGPARRMIPHDRARHRSGNGEYGLWRRPQFRLPAARPRGGRHRHAPGGPPRAPAGRHPRPHRGADRRPPPRRAGHRGALFRGQRPHRVCGRPGPRRDPAGRRPAAIPSRAYTPQQVKAAVCGHGRADKDQVARMVTRLLGLAAPPASDHAADALAVAICDLNRAPLAGRWRPERLAEPGRAGPAMIALVSGTVAVRRGRPRGRGLRRRRLPAGRLGRDARAGAGRRSARSSCTPIWSSATTLWPCTASPPRRSATCS